MKIVHVLKRIETIDEDVKDLRKLEKSLQKDKSFSTPIYMTIEKQISLLVGERVKLLELQVSNPPESLIEAFKESDDDKEVKIPKPLKKKAKRTKKSVNSAPRQQIEESDDDDFDDIPIQMLTQDSIDSKIEKIQKELPKEKPAPPKKELKQESDEEVSDENVKLLDIALRQGSINKDDVTKEKKRVKFFRDNFPGAEY